MGDPGGYGAFRGKRLNLSADLLDELMSQETSVTVIDHRVRTQIDCTLTFQRLNKSKR